ncbi:hypothetical protein FUT87_06335, partial [Mitsuaria sp. TWR114]
MSNVLAPIPAPVPWLARVLGVVLLILGFVMLAAGGLLASLGGSWFYALSGLAWALIGALMWGRLREAVLGYALYFLATLAWSLWEAGLDWWPLGARLGVPFALGAVLLALVPFSQVDGIDVPSPEPVALIAGLL